MPLYRTHLTREEVSELQTMIELHMLYGQCLNRHIATMDKVKSETETWQNCRNYKDAKINWQFTKEDARIKLKGYIR